MCDRVLAFLPNAITPHPLIPRIQGLAGAVSRTLAAPIRKPDLPSTGPVALHHATARQGPCRLSCPDQGESALPLTSQSQSVPVVSSMRFPADSACLAFVSYGFVRFSRWPAGGGVEATSSPVLQHRAQTVAELIHSLPGASFGLWQSTSGRGDSGPRCPLGSPGILVPGFCGLSPSSRLCLRHTTLPWAPRSVSDAGGALSALSP